MDTEAEARFRRYLANLPPWVAGRGAVRLALAGAAVLTVVWVALVLVLAAAGGLDPGSRGFLLAGLLVVLLAWSTWYSTWLLRGAQALVGRP